jgi:hypothetical protein
MKSLLTVTATALLLCGSAQAGHTSKPCNPCGDDVVAGMIEDLQQFGWWQMVPNGADPNDETYRKFIIGALFSLRSRVPPGKFEYVIKQLDGE